MFRSICGALTALILLLASQLVSASTNLQALAETPLTNITFVVFDTETTGFRAASERIVEIGAIKFRNGKILEQRNWLIDPGRPIPENVQQVHGIDDNMVQGRPPFAQVFVEFNTFIQDTVVLAHNARYDVAFLREELRRNSMPTNGVEVIDTIRLCHAWHPDLPSYALKNLVAHFKLDPPGQLHRALADAWCVTAIMIQSLDMQPPGTRMQPLLDVTGKRYFF